MEKFTFNSRDLEKMFSEVENLLLNPKNIFEIKYEDTNNTALNYPANNKAFVDAIKVAPAVYCIWRKKHRGKKFTLVYIGHAKKPGDRMREHLSHKDERTGSCLASIKCAIKNKETIGVSFVHIDPPFMRAAVEDWLIDRHNESLEWNTHGR